MNSFAKSPHWSNYIPIRIHDETVRYITSDLYQTYLDWCQALRRRISLSQMSALNFLGKMRIINAVYTRHAQVWGEFHFRTMQKILQRPNRIWGPNIFEIIQSDLDTVLTRHGKCSGQLSEWTEVSLRHKTVWQETISNDINGITICFGFDRLHTQTSINMRI